MDSQFRRPGLMEEQSMSERQLRRAAMRFAQAFADTHFQESQITFEAIWLSEIKELYNVALRARGSWIAYSDCSELRQETIDKILQDRSRIRNAEVVLTDMDPEDFVEAKDAAKYLGVSTETLRNWRKQKKGPRAFPSNRRDVQADEAVHYYRVSDLIAAKEKPKAN
jgi:hypothetical protein